MACEEHKSAPQMYCKKCDAYVCDICHKIDNPDHYHYLFFEKEITKLIEDKALNLFFEKPDSIDIPEEKEKVTPSSKETTKLIEDKALKIVRQQKQERRKLEEQERRKLEEQKRRKLEEQKRRKLEEQERRKLEEQKRRKLEEQKRRNLEEQKRLKQQALAKIKKNRETTGQ
jgi:hypothetical protein